MKPNMAKNTSVTADAARREPRDRVNTLTSSIGVGGASLPTARSRRAARPTARSPPRAWRADVQPWCGPSMTANTSTRDAGDRAARRRSGRSGVVVGVLRASGRGRARWPPAPTTMTGRLTMNDRAPPEVLEQEPTGDRAERHAETARRRPDGDGRGSLAWVGNTLTSRASVAGKISAAPMPITARARDQLSGPAAIARRSPTCRRTAPGRPAARPCGRSGRPALPAAAAARRTRGRRRRRSTAAGWSSHRARRTKVGRATFTIVPSTTMMNTEMQGPRARATASVPCWCWPGW